MDTGGQFICCMKQPHFWVSSPYGNFKGMEPGNETIQLLHMHNVMHVHVGQRVVTF